MLKKKIFLYFKEVLDRVLVIPKATLLVCSSRGRRARKLTPFFGNFVAEEDSEIRQSSPIPRSKRRMTMEKTTLDNRVTNSLGEIIGEGNAYGGSRTAATTIGR